MNPLLLGLAGCLLDVVGYREALLSFEDRDGDGQAPRDGDCDDDNAAILNGAPEVCDGFDNDCDGVVDNQPEDAWWYPDADGDGYGDPSGAVVSCSKPAEGFITVEGDCDDAAVEVHPGAAEICDPADVDEDCSGHADNGDEAADGRRTWYLDDDGDGHGVDADTVELCDQPAGYAAVADDCDDADDDVNPDQAEVCNGIDDDCNGAVDVDPIDGAAWFADADGDGFGDPEDYVVVCEAVAGRVTDGEDCDDADATVNPDAQEVCDPEQRDEDCDTFTDDGDSSATGQTVFYGDGDGDGHGYGTSYAIACDPPLGYGEGQDDCDDGDPTRYPGAVELCDEVDSDCDGSTDDADAVDAGEWFADEDGDGFGDAGDSAVGCTSPEGWVDNGLDCDDGRPEAWPGAPELCDAVDNDCDGEADEVGDVEGVWFADVDGDGWGDASVAFAGCPEGDGVTTAGDCDDADPSIHPDAAEVCDPATRDEDCDGTADGADALGGDLWYLDADEDGAGDAATAVYACSAPAGHVESGVDCDDADPLRRPGQYELCNAVDDDCDGVVDEAPVDPSGHVDADGDGFGGVAFAEDCAGVATADDCDDADPAVGACALAWRYFDGDGDGWGAGELVEVDATAEGYADVDGDCDDLDPYVSPAAAEICGGGDEDCDGVDDLGAVDAVVGFVDADGDGWGGEAATACDAVLVGGDCDDADPALWDACLVLRYVDADGDGWGAGDPVEVAPADPGHSDTAGDCDDADASVNPDAAERCGGGDEDCDGALDAGAVDAVSGFADDDGDGWGGAASTSCDAVATSGDCDDSAPGTHPGAVEVCGGGDEDCDGAVDVDAIDAVVGYADGDDDGWGDADATTCDAVTVGGDCDDSDATVNPGATEVCGNGLDDDCVPGGCGLEGEHDADEAENVLLGTTAWTDLLMASGEDLDEDGFPEVVAWAIGATDGDTEVFIFSEEPVDLSLAVATIHVATSTRSPPVFGGDLDGDSAGDIAFLNEAAAESLIVAWDPSTGAVGVRINAYVSDPVLRPGRLSTVIADLDGDGKADLAVGNSADDGGGAGRGVSRVWRGPVTGVLEPGDAWLSLPGSADSDGAAVRAACDVDGDGWDDVAIAMPEAEGGSGAVAVMQGPLDWASAISEAAGWWTGIVEGGRFGGDVRCADDLSGDGVRDFAIGASSELGSGGGESWILAGFPSDRLEDQAWGRYTGATTGDRFGDSSSTCDIDGDSTTDLLVGAPGADDGAADGGATYVFESPSEGVFASIDADWSVVGTSDGEAIGDVMSSGDVDHDGIAELLSTSSNWTDGVVSGRGWWLSDANE